MPARNPSQEGHLEFKTSYDDSAPGHPGLHNKSQPQNRLTMLDQAVFNCRDPSASACTVPGSKVCTTRPGLIT